MSSSDEHALLLTRAERETLLGIALESIQSGLQSGHPVSVRHSACADRLAEPGASFVTLTLNNNLRGCIGSLEAHTFLADDVSHNAYAAAFRDPRFAPLESQELPMLSVSVSVLSLATPIDFESEEDLIEKIKPGIDGLILQEHGSKGTFLPSVWESLPQPRRFLENLKLKAGLNTDYWSDTVGVWRYTTTAFSADTTAIREMNRDYLKELLK